MRTIFIYGLWDCRDGRLRYIGKTVNPTARLQRHKVDYDRGKITHCSAWIKGLLNEGAEPMMEILEECIESNWREAERDWIAKGRELGLDLTNMVDGGLGGSAVGRKLSERHKEILRQKLKGRKNTWTKSINPDNLEKMMANTTRMKGKKHKEESKAKIGIANAKALKGRKLSEEQADRLRQLAIARWQREGERDKQREKISSRIRNEKGQFISE